MSRCLDVSIVDTNFGYWLIVVVTARHVATHSVASTSTVRVSFILTARVDTQGMFQRGLASGLPGNNDHRLDICRTASPRRCLV